MSFYRTKKKIVRKKPSFYLTESTVPVFIKQSLSLLFQQRIAIYSENYINFVKNILMDKEQRLVTLKSVVHNLYQ